MARNRHKFLSLSSLRSLRLIPSAVFRFHGFPALWPSRLAVLKPLETVCVPLAAGHTPMNGGVNETPCSTGQTPPPGVGIMRTAGCCGRSRVLLVRSPGFSRRGPGLASQRAGRWRARPAKAGTPNREFANAPAGGCTFSDFGLRISFGFRVSDFGFKVNPTRSQSPAGRRRKALVTGWPTKSRRAYPAGS